MSSIHTGPDEKPQRSSSSAGAIDERSLKRAAALFAAGVTVVTTRRAGGLHGLTLGAFLTVSWDPPLALISVGSLSQSADFIREAGVFAVSFLSDRQEFLAERFAGRAPLVNARFDGVPHHFGTTGAPLLDGALAWLECRVEQIIEAGDHTLFLGRVVGLEEGQQGNALAYFARSYRSIEP